MKYDPVGDYPPGTADLPLGAYLKSEDPIARAAGLQELVPQTSWMMPYDVHHYYALRVGAPSFGSDEWIEYVPLDVVVHVKVGPPTDDVPDGPWCENGWHVSGGCRRWSCVSRPVDPPG